jgi:hypothetical protein
MKLPRPASIPLRARPGLGQPPRQDERFRRQTAILRKGKDVRPMLLHWANVDSDSLLARHAYISARPPLGCAAVAGLLARRDKGASHAASVCCRSKPTRGLTVAIGRAIFRAARGGWAFHGAHHPGCGAHLRVRTGSRSERRVCRFRQACRWVAIGKPGLRPGIGLTWLRRTSLSGVTERRWRGAGNAAAHAKQECERSRSGSRAVAAC